MTSEIHLKPNGINLEIRNEGFEIYHTGEGGVEKSMRANGLSVQLEFGKSRTGTTAIMFIRIRSPNAPDREFRIRSSSKIGELLPEILRVGCGLENAIQVQLS